jgi:hypothetical protein
MADREIIDIDVGDGGAAAIVAGLLVVALAVVALVFFLGPGHTPTTMIDVSAPKAVVSVAPAGQ